MDVIEELVADYDPDQTTERVARRRRQLIGRLISLAITLAVMTAIYFWQRSDGGEVVLWVSAAVILVAVIWTVVVAVLYVRARRRLQNLPTGPAVRIGRGGVQVAALGAPWHEVADLKAVKGRWGGGPLFQLRTTAGATAAVPFDQLAVRAGTLDSTARAYSAGRHGVDLEALEI